MSASELHERLRQVAEENRRLFQRIADGEERLRQLARSVWRGQERERRRLARELHDGVGQTLTALKNQLQWLAQGEIESSVLGQRLAESVALASSALDDTRQLSRMLRPPVLDDLGLEAALRWLARSLEKSSGMQVDLDLDLDIDIERNPRSQAGEAIVVDDVRKDPTLDDLRDDSWQEDGGLLDGTESSGAPCDGERDPEDGYERPGVLTAELETLVFRVVQEALNNVVKHAGTLEAAVLVRRRSGSLELEIRDLGQGFDPVLAGRESGLGLRGIRDRIDIFGGSARIESVPGAGTLVAAILPLRGVRT